MTDCEVCNLEIAKGDGRWFHVNGWVNTHEAKPSTERRTDGLNDKTLGQLLIDLKRETDGINRKIGTKPKPEVTP